MCGNKRKFNWYLLSTYVNVNTILHHCYLEINNVNKQIHNQKPISKLEINKYVNEITTEVN